MERIRTPTEPKNPGVLIDQGPDEWQVLQRQADGTAIARLCGTWDPEGPTEGVLVKGRAVLEDTGESIVGWIDARMGRAATWSLDLALPEGGLYRIETCLSTVDPNLAIGSYRGDMIHHVGVGDVFVIAGQSNAAGYGKDPVTDPPEIGIHLLGNDLRWHLATHPFNESTDTRHPVNREGGNPGHSPWLSYARRLRRGIGVPIGLVQSSLGGSSLSAWNPEEEGSLYRNLLDILGTIPHDVSPRSGKCIRGVLWYQGCSDAFEGGGDSYLARFGRFVAHLREDLHDPDLPFLTVQIGRYVGPAEGTYSDGWAKVREAQRLAAHSIAGVSVVPSLDLSLSDAIHLSSAGNLVLGERAAKAVLGIFFSKGSEFRAPEPSSATRDGKGRIRVRFDYVSDRLDGFGVLPELSPFVVERMDGLRLVPVSVEYPYHNEILLTFASDPGPGSRLHGASQLNPYPVLPIDTGTRLPMLSFYGFQVDD
jgi:hypothetical protein